ncbi:hypothetical protein CP083_00950 [Candidatus Bathyarchaeota archaeon B24-2]|nr:MAG: hypothetical protein CP083_00950 [Candidatus Bathyarchaeota archaeon B24-2]
MELKSSKGLSRLAATLILIALAFILFAPVIPTKETYAEPEPFKREARYEVVSSSLSTGFDLFRGFYTIFEVKIKNTDKYGGNFTVTFYLYDKEGLFGKDVESGQIGSGEERTFRAEFDTRLGQEVRGEYKVTPPIVVDQKLHYVQRVVRKSLIQIMLGL